MTEWTMAAPGSRTQAAAHAETQARPDAVAVEMGQQVPEAAGMTAIPVAEIAADGVIYSTRSLQASGVVQILPQDAARRRARLIAIDGPVILCQTREQAQEAANQTEASLPELYTAGEATTPAAGGNICTIVGNPPAGWYTVTVVAYIDGTDAAATDDDNMKVVTTTGPSPAVGRLLVPSTGQPTTTELLWYLNGAQSISVLAIALATTGAVYHASLSLTPQTPPPAVAPFPGGLYLPAGLPGLDIVHRGAVYVANPAPAAVRISRAVERDENPDPFSHR